MLMRAFVLELVLFKVIFQDIGRYTWILGPSVTPHDTLYTQNGDLCPRTGTIYLIPWLEDC